MEWIIVLLVIYGGWRLYIAFVRAMGGGGHPGPVDRPADQGASQDTHGQDATREDGGRREDEPPDSSR